MNDKQQLKEINEEIRQHIKRVMDENQPPIVCRVNLTEEQAKALAERMPQTGVVRVLDDEPLRMAKRIEELEAQVRVMAGLLRETIVCVEWSIKSGVVDDGLFLCIRAALSGEQSGSHDTVSPALHNPLVAAAEATMRWWEEHQYDTVSIPGGGWVEEYNVYDEEPEHVTISRSAIENVSYSRQFGRRMPGGVVITTPDEDPDRSGKWMFCNGVFVKGPDKSFGPDRELLDGQVTATSVPEGWQLVPAKPTPAMRDAMRNGSRKDWPSDELCNVRYRAMLAAAPKPEAK